MRVIVGGLVLAAVFVAPALAQRQAPRSADETKIRELIDAYDRGGTLSRTDDLVFWSGAIKRPVIGSEPSEEIPTDRQPSLRVPGSQRNRTTPVRIEVAKSSDMAYEYSNSVLTFDLKSGRKEELQTSVLRVWKKDKGEWKAVAMFARPHYQEATAAAAK